MLGCSTKYYRVRLIEPAENPLSKVELLTLGNGESFELTRYVHTVVTQPDEYYFGIGNEVSSAGVRHFRGTVRPIRVSDVDSTTRVTFWVDDSTRVKFKTNAFIHVTPLGGNGLWFVVDEALWDEDWRIAPFQDSAGPVRTGVRQGVIPFDSIQGGIAKDVDGTRYLFMLRPSIDEYLAPGRLNVHLELSNSSYLTLSRGSYVMATDSADFYFGEGVRVNARTGWRQPHFGKVYPVRTSSGKDEAEIEESGFCPTGTNGRKAGACASGGALPIPAAPGSSSRSSFQIRSGTSS